MGDWDIVAERRAVIAPDGALHDYLTQRLTNASSRVLELDHQLLPFYATDADNDLVIAVADGLPGRPGWDAGIKDGCFIVVVYLRGQLEPGHTMLVGVHIVRSGRAVVGLDHIHFQDPMLFRDALEGRPIRAEATLIFPEGEQRQLVAQTAIACTSRSASWCWEVHASGPRQMAAFCASGQVSMAVRRLDDGLALAHVAAAQTTTGEPAPIESARRTLVEALEATDASGWELDEARRAVDCLAALDGLTHMATYGHLLQAIDACTRARPLVQRAQPATSSTNSVEVILAQLLQEIDLRRQESRIYAPRPRDLAVAVRHLLLFGAWWRAEGVRDWRSDWQEKDFQAQFKRFLMIATSDADAVMREVTVERGRVDFILVHTPTELKSVPLGRRGTQPYHQQAAAYASARGESVGVLLVLDSVDHSNERTHLPSLRGQTDVVVVPSAMTRGGPSEPTVVLTLTVHALPPHPSDLR